MKRLNREKLLEHVKTLAVWKKNGVRAPHKPLLLLYAISQVKNNSQRLFIYSEIKEKLKELLIEFGPVRKSYHPEEPFVRLVHDGLWELSNDQVNTKNPSNKKLIEENIAGGFTTDVYQLLKKDTSLAQEITEMILQLHFPETIHEDILAAIGLDFSTIKKKRDRDFRDKVLKAYEYSCAVCGFRVHLGHHLVGIEAAHIKWHQAGGPDIEENGIALCSLHHKLFDRGVFTIDPSRKMIVSEYAHGNNGFEEWLMKYHGQTIKSPLQPTYNPNDLYLNWHVREVFKGPGRYTTTSN
nr:HNH endonuclease [Bacillus aquiflavi]